MSKIRMLIVVPISLALFITLVFVPGVNSRPFRLEKLPDKGKNWGCITCHNKPQGGGALNSFGSDYQALALPVGDVYTKALGKKDSDKDGFSNDEEFNAKPPTKPWDSKSQPPNKPNAVEFNRKRTKFWASLKRKVFFNRLR